MIHAPPEEENAQKPKPKPYKYNVFG